MGRSAPSQRERGGAIFPGIPGSAGVLTRLGPLGRSRNARANALFCGDFTPRPEKLSRPVKVRRESINAMIMDLSIPPGVRKYAPGKPMPIKTISDISPANHLCRTNRATIASKLASPLAAPKPSSGAQPLRLIAPIAEQPCWEICG
jgi:hypothetical protein